MALNETKLSPEIKIKIKNYQVLRNDRTAQGGGVALLIRNNVPFKTHPLNPNISIECICIELPKKIFLVAAYNQPRNNISADDLQFLTSMGGKVVIVGDFNARHFAWNNHITNLNGRTLFNFANDNNLIVHHTPTPTHFPENGTTPTYIDLILNKNVSNITEPISAPELTSDHNPILFQIYNLEKENDTRIITSYKDTDWTELRNFLNEKITINNKITTKEEIDIEVDLLTKNLTNAKDVFTKKIKIRPDKIELDDEIIELIKIRNQTRKIFQQTRQPEIKTTINQLNRTIKRKIREQLNKKWEKTLDELKPGDRALWRISKSFRKSYAKIPTLTKNNINYMTDKDKANIIGDTLQETQTNNQKSCKDPEVTETIDNLNEITTVDPKTIVLTNPKEIKKIIKRLPKNKAPGVDNIDNKLIKNLPRKGIVQLMYIINAILRTGYFPEKWKSAIIVPIPKPNKDLSNPINYRPISLLSSLSKVIEKIILYRLKEIDKKLKILIEEQFGFREGHSTCHQVARIAHSIILNYNKDNVTSMALLDIEKAFDTVWINGIIHKLFKLKFPIYLIRLLKNYLENRKFHIKINQTLSNTKISNAGVPQGSVLGPVLFLYYINDIPKFAKTSIAIYADDTAILAHSFNAQVATKQTQIHLDQILGYAQDWKIKINEGKTEHIVFRRKFTNTNVLDPLKVNQNRITQADNHVKYLGVILDKTLKFNGHIKNLVQKGHAAIRLLYPLLNKYSKLSSKNKKILYTAIIRPAITYAAPVWCSVPKTSILKLQRIQNKCLRLVLNADRYTKITDLHNLANLETIEEFVIRISKNFYLNQIKKSNLTRKLTDREQLNSLPKYTHKFIFHKLDLIQ